MSPPVIEETVVPSTKQLDFTIDLWLDGPLQRAISRRGLARVSRSRAARGQAVRGQDRFERILPAERPRTRLAGVRDLPGAGRVPVGWRSRRKTLPPADPQTMNNSPTNDGLHLCDAAIHKQLRPRNVAAVVGSEKNDCPGDLSGRAEPAERNAGENRLQTLSARS